MFSTKLIFLPLAFIICFLHSRMMTQRHKQLNPAAKFSWIPLEVVKESFKFDFNYFWKVLFPTIVLNLFCIFYCFPSLLKIPSKNTRSSVWNLLALQLEMIHIYNHPYYISFIKGNHQLQKSVKKSKVYFCF